MLKIECRGMSPGEVKELRVYLKTLTRVEDVQLDIKLDGIQGVVGFKCQKWYGGGTIEQIVTRKRVTLRVFMLIEGQERHKDFAVYILNYSQGFTLDGSC